MQIGRLRNRVTIQAEGTATRTESGAYSYPWVDVDTVWADVRRATGQERYLSQAATERSTVDYTVRMRYRSDVTPRNRLIYGTEILDIESVVDPDGRKRELVLACAVDLDG